MTQVDQSEQTESRAHNQIGQEHTPLHNQRLPDFDLDIYRHLFSQDLPHSASSSLELDCSQFPSPFQLSGPVTNHLSLPLSSSVPPSSAPSSAPQNQATSCLSSPSWSSLDHLYLASLPHHPQSSPLFPLDLIPNPNPLLEPTHHQPTNLLNNLSNLSFDGHLHDWNLSFDQLYASSLAENLVEYQTPCRPFDCLEFTENDPHQTTQTVLLQAQGTSPSEEYLKDSNRPTVEDQDYGDFLLSSINAGIPNSIFPPLRQSTPYTPILAMKRMRSSYSQTEDEASLLATADLRSITHHNSITVEQLTHDEQDATIHQNPIQPKPKRPKNRTTSSTSKTHICQECGKSFPRVTSLTQHKLTHNGERPFPCGFEGCSKSFTTSSNMKRHWKTHV